MRDLFAILLVGFVCGALLLSLVFFMMWYSPR